MHIKYISIWMILLFLPAGLLAQETLEQQDPDTVHILGSDEIHLPFEKLIKQEVTTGSITSIIPDEIMIYDNNQDVEDALDGRISGMRGLNLHEFGDALIVVDGVPRPLSSVNLQEIEEITLLKDIHSSVLYGVQAINGIVLIKTKRGYSTDPRISVWGEYGMSSPKRYPNYLNSAEYMELYNEARENDGLSARYTLEEIDGTRSGIDPLRYPDANYFSSNFLNPTRPIARASADFTGGNENAQYYVNAGYLHSGTLLKIGEGNNEQSNRMNLRSNINFKINEFMKSHLDVVAIYDNEKSAQGNFWENSSTFRPNLYPLLIDTSRISYPGANVIDGRFLLGGTSQYQQNIYGDLYLGGYNNTLNTTAQFTTGIDIDFNSLLNGLTFKAQANFDFYKRFRELQNNQYAIYELGWNEDEPSLTKIGSDRFSGTQGVDNTLIRRNFGINGLLNYSRVFNRQHAVSASIITYINRVRQTDRDILFDDKYTHVGLNFNYGLNKKYIIDFSSALAYSIKLPTDNRTSFSPSVGVAWVLSNEGFLENSNVINFLKLKASAGILNTDMNMTDYNLYQDFFATGDSYSWYDGIRANNRTLFQNVANSDLFFEQKTDVNIGMEAGLFEDLLWIDFNLFRKDYKNKISQQFANYPDYLGGFVPYSNFGHDRHTGLDLGLKWAVKMNDFGFDANINVAYIKTEVIQTDEIWEYEYQYRRGKPVNALFGLEAIGLFESEDDINSHSFQMFGEVKPGDIKYGDQNNDGIVDENDEIMLGKGLPELYGGLSLKLSYKNFSLFGMATGIQGSNTIYNNSYYWIYGDRKYSEMVLGRWTPQTKTTATYPRLTTETSSNNFRSSTYWLYDNSRIDINRVQLNYIYPKALDSIGVGSLSFYIRGENLTTISKNRKEMELNVGTAPQYRSYSIGLKAMFY